MPLCCLTIAHPAAAQVTLLVPSQPSIEAPAKPDTPDKSDKTARADKTDKTEKETSQAKGKEEQQKKYRGAENRPDSAQSRSRGRSGSKAAKQ